MSNSNGESETESGVAKEVITEENTMFGKVALGAAVQGTDQVGPSAGSELQSAHMEMTKTAA